MVKLSGEKILNSVFDLHADSMNSWGMFGVLLGYVIVFRFQHYFLFALQTGKLPFMPSKVSMTCIIAADVLLLNFSLSFIS